MSVEGAVANLTLEFVESLPLSSNSGCLIVDVELRVMCLWLEHFAIVIGSIGGVDHNGIINEPPLAKGADPLIVARRHCQEARQAGAVVSAREDNKVSDLFEADDTLSCCHFNFLMIPTLTDASENSDGRQDFVY
jgi:hypothetical protein